MRARTILVLAVAKLAGCATVPFDGPRPYSELISGTSDTSLGRDVGRWLETHDGRSGFHPLSQGLVALGVRLQLAEKAETSLDLQYFLVKNDVSGTTLLKSILKAANRGVRVRLLLDDIYSKAPDRILLLLDQHKNIEVRVFNPISRSGFMALNFLMSFKQANRRMHNKSFTVDNQASVVGGRNIADEYFQLADDYFFEDFEVLAVGPIVNEISESFDQFWNHELAVPIDHFVSNKQSEELEIVRAQVSGELQQLYDEVSAQTLTSSALQELIAEWQPLIVADARLLADSPDKLVNAISDEHKQMARGLKEALFSAREEIIIITPYYVPRRDGIELLRQLTESGLSVTIITNSLASTNHIPVHSAYAKYRKAAIRAGAELYEIRANAGQEFGNPDDPSNMLTLHTKLFLIDRRFLFVGSLNLDPRSIDINAEMGLLIDSPEFTSGVADVVEEKLTAAAYRIVENGRGNLEWHATIDDVKIIETKEPLTSGWRRFKAWIMKIVPESQL